MLVRCIGQCHTAHLLDWVTNDAVMLQGIFIILSQRCETFLKTLLSKYFIIIVLFKTIQFTQKTFTQQLLVFMTRNIMILLDIYVKLLKLS